jgi:hypothetical protein
MDNLLYYVYTWSFPDGDAFYVGMGQGNRYKEMRGRSPLVLALVKQIESMGQSTQRTIIARFKVRQHAQVFERMLIQTYNYDYLANLKSENGPTREYLAKPAHISTIEIPRFIPKKHKDRLLLSTTTTQPWEDDGAMI